MGFVAHKFMRDSDQVGDESTVQTAPRFARGCDLSIDEKVRLRSSVSHTDAQQPRRGQRNGGVVADNGRRTVDPASIASRFRIWPGVARPGLEVTAPDHDGRRARPERRYDAAGKIECECHLPQLQVVGIFEISRRKVVCGQCGSLRAKRRRAINPLPTSREQASDVRRLIKEGLTRAIVEHRGHA